jgi:hypothetical protein
MHIAGHENKDLLSESFRLFDILKLWEWEAVPER